MVVAAEELLKKINFNKTKQTIVDPQRQWFRKELKNWVLSILDNAESSKDVFNISYIKSYFENYYCKTRNPQSSFQLFQFINTVIWREKVMKSHAVK